MDTMLYVLGLVVAGMAGAVMRGHLDRLAVRRDPVPGPSTRDITHELRAIGAGWNKILRVERTPEGATYYTGRGWVLTFSLEGDRLFRLEAVQSPHRRYWYAAQLLGDIGDDRPTFDEIDPLTLLEQEEPEAYKLAIAILQRALPQQAITAIGR